jgi:hypothetical protein
MPTGAKLIGALLLGSTALYFAYMFMNASPPGTVGNTVYGIGGAIGVIVGWRAIGFDPGFGGIGSIVAGLKGAFLLVFFMGISYGTWVIILKLKEFRIKKIENLLGELIDAVMGFYQVIFDPTILAAVAVGGCISGVAAGIANRIAK